MSASHRGVAIDALAPLYAVDATTPMLPPKIDAALTVAHARTIKEHRDAHHKATQDHRLAQERCELLEEENRELRAADARRE